MISGFGEVKFRKVYLTEILDMANKLNITNPEDIAKADEMCCRDELEEFKKIFKFFPNINQNLSLDLYEKRIIQEVNEITLYFKTKTTSNKKANLTDILKLKNSIMSFRNKIKAKRQQCPFCVKSLKKLKFHLFRINIKQKLLGCKYFQDEIARTNDLKKQLELYYQALKYGAPNIKYPFEVIEKPVLNTYKNNPIKTSKDALEFCRFLWRVLVEKRESEINRKKEIFKLKHNKNLYDKEVCGEDKFNNIKHNEIEEKNNFNITLGKKVETIIDKIKHEKNKNKLGETIKIIEFGTSDESSTDNISLDEMCKKGKMVKYIIGQDNNNSENKTLQKKRRRPRRLLV